jgi:hypothetical protein
VYDVKNFKEYLSRQLTPKFYQPTSISSTHPREISEAFKSKHIYIERRLALKDYRLEERTNRYLGDCC